MTDTAKGKLSNVFISFFLSIFSSLSLSPSFFSVGLFLFLFLKFPIPVFILHP